MTKTFTNKLTLLAATLTSLLGCAYWSWDCKPNVRVVIQPTYRYPDEWNRVNYVWSPTGKEKNLLHNLMVKRYTKRRQDLQKFCSENNSTDKIPPSQLISASSKKLTVCYIQKAGSTSWNRLVWRLRHNVVNIPNGVGQFRSDNLRDTKHLSYEKKWALVNSSLSVLTVRHPFGRLISGWNNKLHREFIRTHGNTVLRSMPSLKYYLMAEEESPDHALTFERFLEFIINESFNRTRAEWIQNLDAHFRPMFDICYPCKFPYKYIVKVETAPDDIWYVLDQINITMTSFISQTNVTSQSWMNSERKNNPKIPKHFSERTKEVNQEIAFSIETYFRNVEKWVTRKLMDLYRSDFEAFGYSFDIQAGTVGKIT